MCYTDQHPRKIPMWLYSVDLKPLIQEGLSRLLGEKKKKQQQENTEFEGHCYP